MPRIRTIKPEFFRHELLQDLEEQHPHARVMLVFAGLWTVCDSKGRFRDKPRTLKLDILPFLSFDMDATLQLLEQNGFIHRYEVEGERYGCVLQFEEHQRITGKEATEGEKYPSAIETDQICAGKQQGNNGETPEKHPVAQEKEKEREKEEEVEKETRESADAASPPEDDEVVLPKWTNQDMANASKLRDQIALVDPAYVESARRGTIDLEKWADEFRLIRQQDKRQQADIEFIITHFPRDGFWSGNIRSPGSLRGLTKTSRKDKFLTILASVKKSVQQDGRQNGNAGNGTPKDLPDQFKRPILELDLSLRAGALRKLGLNPEHYDLEQLVPR